MSILHFTQSKSMRMVLLLGIVLAPRIHLGQPRTLTLDEALRSALTQNPGLKAIAAETSAARYDKRTASEIPKTQVLWMSGQYNSINQDNNLTLTQSLPFPTVFSSQAKLGEKRVESNLHREAVARNELQYRMRQIHQVVQYLYAKEGLLKSQDTLFAELVRTTSLQLTTGEGTLLQKTAAETRYNEVKNQLRQNKSDQLTYNAQLKVLLHAADEVTFQPVAFVPLSTTLLNDSAQVANNPRLALQQSLREVALQAKKVEANRALPDISVGYFTQTLIGIQTLVNGTDQTYTSSDRFTGFTLGVAVPLWFVPASSRVKAAGARSDAEQYHTEYVNRQLHGEWNEAVQQFEKFQISLDYYRGSALPNADLLIKHSTVAFRAGEISQADFRLNVQQALSIQEAYLQTVLNYNQSIQTLEFLSGAYSKNQ